ncbi:N-acetyltransferase [Arthrobacter sp. TMN-50]
MPTITIRPCAPAEVETALRMKNLVWVLEGNCRAIAFCRKLGFEPDRAQEQLSPRWHRQVEIRMARQ